jgi:hypothetical protein
MSDVRKALIWGIENPPREYTLEEWAIISEFASYVATKYDESQRPFEQALKNEPKRETFEVRCKREYEDFQRGIKKIAKGKIWNEKTPPSISIEDIKDIDSIECRIDFKCVDCKYRECEVNEYPCNECEKSSKFEKRKTK